MKKVICLIGLDHGKERFMHPHEADAAVSTGVACWPEDFVGADEAVEETVYEDLPIREIAGTAVMQGAWPQNAVITSRMQNSGWAEVFRSGTIVVTLGDRKAIYQSIGNVEGSRDHKAVLREVQDEAPETDEVEAVESVQDDAADTPPESAPALHPVESFDEDATDGEGPDVDVIVPNDWKSMHWKQRVQLASRIAGKEVQTVGEANDILEKHFQG